jgi:hypothetical protein
MSWNRDRHVNSIHACCRINRVHRVARSIGSTIFIACTFVILSTALADDAIEGVQPAALDQPRIFMCLRRDARGKALETSDKEALSGIEAFLDTGASGIVLSSDTCAKLGVKSELTRAGQPISYEDVGVGGTEKFTVAEPLFFALAPYPNGDDPTNYDKPFGAIRAQIRPESGILALIAPGMDVAGMPAMAGKVVVIDTKPLAQMDKLHTIVVPLGDRSIPKTNLHVSLSYVSFARFTKTSPASAIGPNVGGNPMIGPDPFRSNDNRKPIVVTHHGKSASGTFLLDTGAATSMISTKLARQLGIKLTVDGAPIGIAKERRFSLPIGGLGGQKNASGLFFDRLEIPTTQVQPIAYAGAPLLICDITVVDAEKNSFTLDGVLGMNYLVASAEITGGLLPDVGKISDSPFRYLVIDHVRGQLDLQSN